MYTFIDAVMILLIICIVGGIWSELKDKPKYK